MTPFANYTFRVIAKNKIGPSPPSEHSNRCTTPPDRPYKNPDNVKGYGVTSTNLVIKWTVSPFFSMSLTSSLEGCTQAYLSFTAYAEN